MYVITVCDELFGQFNGEFDGTRDEAIEEAREFYAFELDTTPECIEILSVIEREERM